MSYNHEEQNNTIRTESVMLLNQSDKRRFIGVFCENTRQAALLNRLGIVFGILEGETNALQKQNIQYFINEAIEKYYKSPKNYDESFDDFIRLLNSGLAPSDRYSVCFGVIKNTELIFCSTPGIGAHIVSPKGIKQILPEEELPGTVRDRLFSTAQSGQISYDYALYFYNLAFAEAVDIYKLNLFIKKYGAEETIDIIRENVSKLSYSEQSGALFIYNRSKAIKKITSGASIEELAARAQNTQNRLAPSITAGIKKILGPRPIISTIAETIYKLLKITAKILKFIFKNGAAITAELFFIATDFRGKRKENKSLFKKRFADMALAAKNKYGNLPVLSKISLIGGTVAAVALTINLAFASQAAQLKEWQNVYDEKTAAANTLVLEAESSILFNDKNTAIQKINAALAALNAVPDKVRDAKYAERYAAAKAKLQKLQNITEIASPVVLIDSENIGKSAFMAPLFIFGDQIVAANVAGMAKINATGGGLSQNPFRMPLQKIPAFYSGRQKTLYIMNNSNSLQTVNPDTLESSLKEIVTASGESINSLTIYNDKAYVLSYDEKQFSIWKHDASISGFGRPALWINDTINNDAHPLSFGIDGNLYLLYSDNTLAKYYKNENVKWNYNKKNIPAGLQYFKVFTSDDYSNLYLAAKNGVSILSKNGDFLGHLLLPGAGEILDIAVDEKNKTVYIMTAQKIYSATYNLNDK